ncbi:MAG: DUF5828 family protein [Candidatus Aenigmatarchaeota archaeon]
MKNQKIEVTNSGVQFKGGWKEVCHFARSVEDAMEKGRPDEESLQDYEDWRPREEEDIEELSEKTAKKACIKKKKVEKEYNGAKEELDRAGRRIKNSVSKNSAENFKKASKSLERVFEAGSIKTIRILEKMIYSQIMLRFNPCYFDTDFFSVNLEESGEGKKKDYRFSVNISDDRLRERVKEELHKKANN